MAYPEVKVTVNSKV